MKNILFASGPVLACWRLGAALLLGAVLPLGAQEPAAAPESAPTEAPAPAVVAPPAATEAPPAAVPAPSAAVPVEAPTAAPVPPRLQRGEVVVFGSDVLIRENETASKVVAIGGDVEIRGRVDGEVVAIGGEVAVHDRVGGELVAIGGDATIDAPIGKLVAVGGEVTLGPRASVGGEAVVVLGDLENPHHVPIMGQSVEVGSYLPHPSFGNMLFWAGDAVTHARLLSFGVAWPWYVFGTAVLFCLLLAAVFGRGLNACAQSLEERPAATLATALLLLPLLPLFTLLLICTVLGVLLLPFLGVAVAFAFAFGKAAMLVFLGRSVLRAGGATEAAGRAWLTVLIGAALLAVLYCVPVLGVLLWALTGWIGLGMVAATLLERRRREKAATAAAAARLRPAPVAPATAPAGVAVAPAAFGAVAAEVAPATGFGAAETVAGAATTGENAADPAAASVTAPPFPPPVLPARPALVEATLPRADFWVRLGALLIDIVLVAVGGGVSALLALVPFPLLFGGYMFALWLWRGTSVGGIVFNLKIVRLDGRPVDGATAAVRTLVAFLSVVSAGLGFLWCLWDDERQTWHDKVAGTTVVRLPKAVALV